MDLGPFLIETHLRTGRPIAELASSHGVHRSWLYKLLKRYRLEGPGGLQARSRRPVRSPSRIVDRYEDEIVALRKELLDLGVDAGVRTFYKAAETLGFPQSVLTDNGLIFTNQSVHGFAGAFEMELAGLGILSKHSRPYHPQTCGKVERFHQTLKKFLAEQDPIYTKKQLQACLDRFVAYYNEVRPHRAIGRRTPKEAYAAREKARPKAEPLDLSGGRKIRHDKLDSKGTVTLRINGRMHHVPCGRAYAGWRVRVLVDG